jgi:hypothetical protein
MFAAMPKLGSTLVAAAVGLTAIVTNVGCGAARPRVCRTTSACGDGEACVVGKCSPATAPGPVSSTTRRIVLEPESIAWISTSGEGAEGERITALSLGASVGEHGRILVRFPRGDWSKESVVKAYLVLDRAEGAQAGPGDVLLRADRIVTPWSASAHAGTSWASPPEAVSMIGGEAKVAPRGAVPIRIEVTPYAIELAKKGARSWGLRVEGKGEGFGVPIATGFGGGQGPRLEVYVSS